MDYINLLIAWLVANSLTIATVFFTIEYNIVIFQRIKDIKERRQRLLEGTLQLTWKDYLIPILAVLSHVFFVVCFSLLMFNVSSIFVNSELLIMDAVYFYLVYSVMLAKHLPGKASEEN